MGSMAPDPVYRVWGAGVHEPKGWDGVRSFYEHRLLEGERLFWRSTSST